MMLTLAALFLAVPDTSLTDRVAKLEAMIADLASKHADLNSKYERALERIAQQEHTIRSPLGSPGMQRIRLVFHHDPTTVYGGKGSLMLVSSVMRYASAERIHWHVLSRREHLNASAAFVERIGATYPKTKATLHAYVDTLKLLEIAHALQGQNHLCSSMDNLQHHLNLVNTLPRDIGVVLVLDTDMVVMDDIAILWDEVVHKLSRETPIAAHKNCARNVRYNTLLKKRNVTVWQHLGLMQGQSDCTYDTGMFFMVMDAPSVQSFLSDVHRLVTTPFIFDVLRLRVSCTRDLMNVLLRNRFTAGIPDQWMLGQACSRRHIPEQTRLLHFSGYKPWSSRSKCKRPALEVYSRATAMIKTRLYDPACAICSIYPAAAVAEQQHAHVGRAPPPERHSQTQ